MLFRRPKSFFDVTEFGEDQILVLLRDIATSLHLLSGRSPMKSFTHPQGESHLYQLVPLKSNPPGPDLPGATSTDVVYTVDNPAIATVTGNTSVAQQLQCTVAYVGPGTATITSTGTNEQGNPFSSQFQAIVTPIFVPVTDHFDVNEIS